MATEPYSNLTIRLDTQKKQDFEALSKRMGMSMNTAINLFVTAMLRTGKLPFEVIDPLEDPARRKLVEQELERRLQLADDPDTKWYGTEEVKKELGL